MRNATLIRNLQILRRLEGARVGASIAELSAEFAVTTRTIRRDLEAIEAAGVPLVAEAEKRWRVFR